MTSQVIGRIAMLEAGDVAAVASIVLIGVCVSRGTHPLIVFDRHGKFLSSWGTTFSNSRMG